MKLIKYDNYTVTISDEALLVGPIRKLFNSDRTKTKESFFQQMSILFFMKDPRSSYNYLVDENERYKAILEQEGLPANTKISPLLKEAMEVYEKLVETPSAKLLRSAIKSAHNLGEFLETVDYKELDSKGKPIWQPSSITSSLDKVPSIVKRIQETQKLVDSEITEAGRVRGGSQTKKLFEDGIRNDN